MTKRRPLDGWQKREEKREKRMAKIEGREENATFNPITLALMIAAGSILTLLQPLNILLITFPLFTRKTVKWDFKICLKIAAMISTVYTITVLIFVFKELDGTVLRNVILGFIYNIAVSSLILYVGSFLVNYLNQK